MKKVTLASIIIGSFILFSLIYVHTNTPALPPNSSTESGSSVASTPTSAVPAASGTPGTSDATGTSSSAYKDGTYTGSVADAQWGYIQVQVVIQNGRMANITFLQYPNERERSVVINDYADPRLVSEAIQAQSANVDAITGATDTSQAFMQSLTDALSQANA